ncbi:MAG: hypothetical protein RRC07_00955 [Anaerolineae bacterium]|nr:hypothetical protein [Anaerolineae bacterium]
MNPQTGGLPTTSPGYRAESRYDDVWAGDEVICAFCAAPVIPARVRCSGCDQKLRRATFRYAQPSSNVIVLWVLVAASGFLYLILVLGDLLQGSGLPLATVHVFVGLVFLTLSAGIYLRQFWAWAASIPILLLTLLLSLLQVIGVDASVLLPQRLEDVSVATLNTAFLQSLISLLYTLLLVAQGGALVWALLIGGPDFARDPVQIVARLERGLVNAADYYTVGRRYAQQGMWATAVLHWQRAAALAPHSGRYLLVLAEGYARLGFFERSADVLQSIGTRATGDVASGAERLRQRLAHQGTPGTKQ